MVSLTRASSTVSEVFEPHRIEYVVSIGSSEIDDLGLVHRKETVKQILVHPVDSCASWRDHAKHLGLVPLVGSSERGADYELRCSRILTICNRRNLAGPLNEVSEDGILVPAIPQFDSHDLPDRSNRRSVLHRLERGQRAYQTLLCGLLQQIES